MKYIIDVPNNGYVSENDGCLYIPLRSDGCDPLMVNPTWLLTGYHAEPYIEPDREAIENEVWENTWKMFLTPEDFGATRGDSYSEAKAKYDAWKKQKEEEIHVGDEVFLKGDPHKEKAIVLRLYQPKMYKPVSDVLWADGSVEKTVLVEKLMRTDRHFDEVDELLKKMRGEEE